MRTPRSSAIPDSAERRVTGCIPMPRLPDEVPDDATKQRDSPMDRMERARQGCLGADIGEGDAHDRTATSLK